MRKELLKLINNNDTEILYSELSESAHCTNDLIKLRINDVNKMWSEVEKENPDLVNDIMDDIIWYASIENQIIIQSGIWRLHSLFEKIIRQELFKKGINVWTFKEILKAMRVTLCLEESIIEEVRLWGELRHKLSHRPLDRITATPLIIEDLDCQLQLYSYCLKKINPDFN